MTVICLESDIEKDYSQFLSEFIEETIGDKNPESIATIRSFWDDEYSWEDIQEMAAVEGNTWYVWWMGGVRRYMEKELSGMAERKEVPKCAKCGREVCPAAVARLYGRYAGMEFLRKAKDCDRHTIKRLIALAGAGWHAAKDAHRSVGDALSQRVDEAALKEVEDLERLYEDH